ncbi:MAG: hypothetical protein AB7G25_07990 [Sphingomonadaceae bacterium]
MAEGRTIVVSADPTGYGFDVEIIPPPDGVGHDREFQSYREAYGYASGLRLALGWPVRDLTGKAPHGAS